MSTQLIDVLNTVIIFAFGISFGSFLNVIIERIPRGLTIDGRSHCPTCLHELGIGDLIPLFSFFLLRSRCHYCKGSISWQYPAVEFFTGLLFVLIFFSFPLPYSIIYIILFSVLLALFVIDLKFGVVPTSIVYPSIIFALLVRIIMPLWESLVLYLRLASDNSGFGRYLIKSGFFSTHLGLQIQLITLTVLGALAIAFFFYLLVVFTKKRGMGDGDIIYALLVALVAGFPNMFVVIVLTFLIGAVVSLILVSFKRKKFGQTVPLGPFLSFSTFIGVFWGNYLVDLYLNLLK